MFYKRVPVTHLQFVCRIEKEKNALQAEGDDLAVSLETLQKQKVLCIVAFVCFYWWLIDYALVVVLSNGLFVCCSQRLNRTNRTEPSRNNLMIISTRWEKRLSNGQKITSVICLVKRDAKVQWKPDFSNLRGKRNLVREIRDKNCSFRLSEVNRRGNNFFI